MDEELEKMLADRKPAVPGWFYNQTGDRVEAYWEGDEASYADYSVGGGIVLIRALDGDRIIGVALEGAYAKVMKL